MEPNPQMIPGAHSLPNTPILQSGTPLAPSYSSSAPTRAQSQPMSTCPVNMGQDPLTSETGGEGVYKGAMWCLLGKASKDSSGTSGKCATGILKSSRPFGNLTEPFESSGIAKEEIFQSFGNSVWSNETTSKASGNSLGNIARPELFGNAVKSKEIQSEPSENCVGIEQKLNVVSCSGLDFETDRENGKERGLEAEKESLDIEGLKTEAEKERSKKNLEMDAEKNIVNSKRRENLETQTATDWERKAQVENLKTPVEMDLVDLKTQSENSKFSPTKKQAGKNSKPIGISDLKIHQENEIKTETKHITHLKTHIDSKTEKSKPLSREIQQVIPDGLKIGETLQKYPLPDHQPQTNTLKEPQRKPTTDRPHPRGILRTRTQYPKYPTREYPSQRERTPNSVGHQYSRVSHNMKDSRLFVQDLHTQYPLGPKNPLLQAGKDTQDPNHTSMATQYPTTGQSPTDLRMPSQDTPDECQDSVVRNPTVYPLPSCLAVNRIQDTKPCLEESCEFCYPTVTQSPLLGRRMQAEQVLKESAENSSPTSLLQDCRMGGEQKLKNSIGYRYPTMPKNPSQGRRIQREQDLKDPIGRGYPAMSQNPSLGRGMQSEQDPNVWPKDSITDRYPSVSLQDCRMQSELVVKNHVGPNPAEPRNPLLGCRMQEDQKCIGKQYPRQPRSPLNGSRMPTEDFKDTILERYPRTPLFGKSQDFKESHKASRNPTCILRCSKPQRGARAFQGVKLPLLILLLAGVTSGSEFPDRECCDSVPPPPHIYHQVTSTTTTTTPAPPPGQKTNTSIVTVSRGASGVINCIEARHQCRNDGQCRDVLEMLHKICGPELVACATVTPGKCKTLLRTLGQYEYMKSCTCREPHIDFNCYTFREMIFNHPCSLVDATEDTHTYMPTCTQAAADCKQSRACFKNYMDFLKNCGYRGITCTSQQSDKCNESWMRVRMSPYFGCYCPPQIRYPTRGVYEAATPSQSEQEECMRSYNDTHANPCLEGQKDIAKATMVETAQAMCHVALEQCQNDEDCAKELNNINTWCEHSHCEPDRCRNALQDFYQRVKVARRIQVAFCVCRQSDHDGECLMAMRKLHPTCAERHTPRDPMQCHKIADQCRKNRACSAKLEEYEQKCAADAMTGLCSDTHRNCQHAVMNILGTELHATCVCKGTDFLHQQDCYTWQKLLWSNPCVIESHLKLHEDINNGAETDLDEEFRRLTPAPPTTPAPRVGPPPHPEGHDYGSVVLRPETDEEGGGAAGVWTRGRGGVQIGTSGRKFGGANNIGRTNYDLVTSYGKPEDRDRIRYPTPDGAEVHFRGRGIDRPTNVIPNGRNWGYGRGTFGHRGTGLPPFPSDSPGPVEWDTRFRGRRPGGVFSPDVSEEDNNGGEGYKPTATRSPVFRGQYPPRTPPVFLPVTPTAPSMAPSTTTTASDTATTAPTRACTMKNNHLKTVVIPEGSYKRFFRGDSDCSELCSCSASIRGKDPEAKCFALSCMDKKACNTSRANYPHNAPYYLAFRGVCMCYGGRFICQKPEPGEYTLGPGIYLFLGYSRGEVEILKPHTSTNEHEAIKVLESVLVRDYDFKCELTTKHHIGENFIVVAKLQMNPDTYISPFVKQRREKEMCAGPLEDIAKKINSRPRHEDIRTDAVLSMFVLAKVDVNLPEPHTSPSRASTPSHALPATLLVLLGAHLLTKTLLLNLKTST